eukprot:4506198-Amphidinium_carterae.2
MGSAGHVDQSWHGHKAGSIRNAKQSSHVNISLVCKQRFQPTSKVEQGEIVFLRFAIVGALRLFNMFLKGNRAGN